MRSRSVRATSVLVAATLVALALAPRPSTSWDGAWVLVDGPPAAVGASLVVERFGFRGYDGCNGYASSGPRVGAWRLRHPEVHGTLRGCFDEDGGIIGEGYRAALATARGARVVDGRLVVAVDGPDLVYRRADG